MEDNNENHDLVDIPINVAGKDFTVTVDLSTANELLNNPSLAEMYVKTAFPESFQEGFPPDSEESQEQQPKRKVWYSKGKPSADDDEATALFLQIRQQLNKKFSDKKTIKNKLWADISKQLEEAGFDLCSPNPAEKCKQKFLNMEKAYMKHVKHMRSTGTEKKEPPPFFSEMHSILGSKDKVCPKNLEDTEDTEAEGVSTETEDSLLGEGTSAEKRDTIINRFAKVKKPRLPKTTNEVIIEELKRQHDADREESREHFEELTSLLKTQNKQRSEMIELFREYVDTKKAKNE